MKNIEIIIVNDCSTDKSEEIIREYAEKDKELDSEFYQKLNTLQTQNNELWVKQQELV